jgi:hypothetical protein
MNVNNVVKIKKTAKIWNKTKKKTLNKNKNSIIT